MSKRPILRVARVLPCYDLHALLVPNRTAGLQWELQHRKPALGVSRRSARKRRIGTDLLSLRIARSTRRGYPP